jgi:hypothetical protein
MGTYFYTSSVEVPHQNYIITKIIEVGNINIDNDYQWVGKRRKGNKTKGGIGVCVSRELTILDENLTDSKTDSFERLWSVWGHISTHLPLKSPIRIIL